MEGNNYQNRIIIEEKLSGKNFDDIKKLVEICNKKDNIDLKFYLDGEIKNITKFLFYDEENIIAYFGITPGYNVGMYYTWCIVHPKYRTKEIFSELFKTVKHKCRYFKIYQ